MFATVTISLPVAAEQSADKKKSSESKGQGGELVVKHKGEEKTFDLAAGEQARWVSFFTDLPHEIKPLTSGFRVALTYNAFRVNGDQSKSSSDATAATESKADPTDLEKLKKQGAEFSKAAKDMLRLLPARKIGWILEHKYAAKSLTLEHLKGADARLLKALQYAFGDALKTASSSIGATQRTLSSQEIQEAAERKNLARLAKFDTAALLKLCELRKKARQREDKAMAQQATAPFDLVLRLEHVTAHSHQRERYDYDFASFDSGNEGATIGYLYKRTALFLERSDNHDFDSRFADVDTMTSLRAIEATSP